MKKIFLLLCLIALYYGTSQTKTAYENAKNEGQKEDFNEDKESNTDSSSLDTLPAFKEPIISPKEEDSSCFKTDKSKGYTETEWEVFKEEWYTKYGDTKNGEDFWDVIFNLQGKKQL
ncbi:hypothetical protein [Flavobacterium hercynium]|uniref:Uncharacterized protein n=1 Tax=Flavobacterium hercynium TaxID=387094 RepID=A0A226HAC3_9FLAO|nr:hypothetical protein [Flavobacterium hercynium]OXA91233.1 hypothetical protein B0A66_11695 [Flavobacterium hercynium]SMP12128.1 hypothetical protein SAMN06265346_103215 [Flavobacterium hercynium]